VIKNRTSTVPVDRTISRIETFLVRAGAQNIFKDYSNGDLKGVCFSFYHPVQKRLIAIRLPANVPAIEKCLLESMKRPRRETRNRLHDQAARTAWKLMQDWIEVQVSLIEMEQAEFLQVFLPYVWDGKRTFYAALQEGGFKLLGAPAKEEIR
jgi:hypothetical protein